MKSALIRSVRTFLQVLAGALVAFPTVDAVADIRAIRDPILVAFWTAGWSALVSFAQNAAEVLGDHNGAPRG